MTYLADTNLVSELRKIGSPLENANVVRWAGVTPASSIFISVITLEELEIGILRLERRDPRQAANLRVWLETSVRPTFANRILPVDEEVALKSASMHVPDPRPIRDAYLAATALVHGMTVATRNTRDFVPLGVPLFDPWQS